MATFIEIRTDAFAKNLADKGSAQAMMTSPAVRRPLRGIEIKPDRYATLMVRQANGNILPLTDAGSRAGVNSGQSTTAGGGVVADGYAPRGASSYVYSNFIIESIDDSRQEKAQIMETFGEPYVFFFGEHPRMLNIAGLLFNTQDFNWRSEFLKNYEDRLRGTRLVEQNARLYLRWDDIVVEGYPMNVQITEAANEPYTVRFSFSLFVTNHTYLSEIGSDDFPTASYTNRNFLQQDISDPSFKDTLVNGQASAAGVRQLTGIAAGTGVALGAVAFSAGLAGADNTHPKAVSAKILKNAISMGLMSSSMTFLQVVEEYFKGKRVANPKRILPMRSKIRDNFDEYVTDGDGGVGGGTAPFDMDYVQYMREKQEKAKTREQTAGMIQRALVAVGSNPIRITKDGISSPLGRAHAVASVQNASSSVIGSWGTTLLKG